MARLLPQGSRAGAEAASILSRGSQPSSRVGNSRISVIASLMQMLLQQKDNLSDILAKQNQTFERMPIELFPTLRYPFTINVQATHRSFFIPAQHT